MPEGFLYFAFSANRIKHPFERSEIPGFGIYQRSDVTGFGLRSSVV